MKILHVISRLECHGAARQLELLHGALSRTVVVRICVLGNETPAVRRWRDAGMYIEALGWTRFSLPAWWRLRRLIGAYQPRIVHAWDAGALRAVSFCRGRAALVAQAEDGTSPGWHERRALRRADRVIVRSQAQHARALAYGLRPDRLVLITPVVPAIDADARTVALPKTPPGRWIICAGELTANKGVHDAVWAFDYLRFLYPDLHLVILGDGPDRPRLERLARRLRAEARVHFLGPRDNAADFIARADVVWAPDFVDRGMNIVLEAMASGRAVVATATPSRAELMPPELAARLVPPGDKVALARQTRVLLDDPESARRQGCASRDHVRRHFSVQRMSQGFLELYSELAGERVPVVVGTPVPKPDDVRGRIPRDQAALRGHELPSLELQELHP